MTPYPRGERNVPMECDCGAAVVKMDVEYVCVGCGEVLEEADEDEARPDPVA